MPFPSQWFFICSEQAVIKVKLERYHGAEAAQPGSTDLSVFSATSSWRGVSKRTPWADQGRWRKWHTASPSWHPMLPASLPESTFPSMGVVTRCARDETGDVKIKQCNEMAPIPLCFKKEVCLSKKHLIYWITIKCLSSSTDICTD